MEAKGITHQQIKRIGRHHAVDLQDQLAVEEPLEIRIAYRSEGRMTQKAISVTMRTPGNDAELAVGFLFSEGIIKLHTEIKEVAIPTFEENIVLVTLADSFEPALKSLERNFYTTSSCGVCGKASIDAIKTVSDFKVPSQSIQINREVIFQLDQQIEAQQHIFESTGGLHASFLFDQHGDFLMLREDVGRHNALDKLIGATFLADKLPLFQHILLLSGRASFELIQKAAMAGIQIVAAIGAPSSLAVQLAEESDITLIGFLRNERFNIYTGFHRILDI
ncbi:formate dehydrogenase accessory sulfurtransferase FdhD [Dyadobacter arcticus]|uniref:Sulfur carrier protein FdhD n=1 Tax=Dyadobacter arcticus TaxID=1078754 RepID=A0ABX0UNH9_9BACT|nr:formate dehydrogenase accessory sulfurtransferase FdhD [Dyadobacter arcticus]NIJ53245.1 FdhD protein [Dyadobacter arcticus]